MSVATDITEAMQLALKDDGTGLDALKNALTENGFKHCVVSTNIMLAEMKDRGMETDTAIFYGAIAACYLPYSPAEVTA